jgi:hypothetical protein
MKEVNLKELLNQINAAKGWTECTTNDEFYGMFEELGNVIWSSAPDNRRWYSICEVVRELSFNGESYFFFDEEWEADGDNSRSDCGWTPPDVDKIQQAFPKQVMTTTYVTKERFDL